jgi:hypothetical protein
VEEATQDTERGLGIQEEARTEIIPSDYFLQIWLYFLLSLTPNNHTMSHQRINLSKG